MITKHKFYPSVFLLLFCLVICQTASSQNTPKELAILEFEALKTKSDLKFDELLIPKSQYWGILETIMGDSPEQNKIDSASLEVTINETRRMAKWCFNNTIEKGELQGINWKKISYVEMYHDKRKDGLKKLDNWGTIYMTIAYKKEDYLIEIDFISHNNKCLMERDMKFLGLKK
ncbi:MAG: hypothetical protein HRT71_04965 [Flavobacteriales bacterium]|nr:hypothetical protein [Flavobacteriales bacterium]